MPPAPPLPAETIRAERRRAAWAVGLTLAAAANVTAAVVVLSGVHVWQAGALNLDPPFFIARADGPWLLLWVATSVGLIAAALAAATNPG